MKQKRYRMKNRDKVKQSPGFDVDVCTGRLPSGIRPIQLTSSWWELAHAAAQVAVAKYNLDEAGPEAGPVLKFKELVKANMQGIAGVMYYLTLTALDTTDQVEKIYLAKVSDTAGMPAEEMLCVESFEIFTTGDKTAEEMRLEIEKKFKKLAKKGIHKPSSELCMYSTYKEPTRRELSTKGFYILLKEIRDENPRWKYATAKRVTSRKWKSLNSLQQWAYQMRARDEILDKQYGPSAGRGDAFK